GGGVSVKSGARLEAVTSYHNFQFFFPTLTIEDGVTIEENCHITADGLERAIITARQGGKNPKKLIINYPNNPSGLTITTDRLEEIAQVCAKYSILVISDEIYGLVNFEHNHISIARFYPQGTIITSGLSKHLSLGGYRLGVALIPKGQKQVFEAVVRIASETWSSVSAPVQFAAIEAFKADPALESYIRTCTRIHCLVAGHVRSVLIALGIKYPELHGAFYLYPNFGLYETMLKSRGVFSSEGLAKDLLDNIQLATLPGTAFGDDPQKLTLRLATCDFDGRTALDYFNKYPDCTPESFVHACCPNIMLAGQRLAEYFAYLKE
ncbi:MAG: pyridoxal phosphate-dependent aminotransferase, partial [Anaerolineaceae bacterium]|nr:pyridoxal phosphate-dependent aminotransferase [Anaerolineaceae bacterium]